MARPNPRQAEPRSTEPAPEVVFRVARSFLSSAPEKFASTPGLEDKFNAFKAAKMQNRMQPFGSSDSLFIPSGPIAKYMPGLRHAHLNRDLSILYTMTGANPSVITLYGIFSHGETGTGTPANINKQKSIGKSLSKQSVV